MNMNKYAVLGSLAALAVGIALYKRLVPRQKRSTWVDRMRENT